MDAYIRSHHQFMAAHQLHNRKPDSGVLEGLWDLYAAEKKMDNDRVSQYFQEAEAVLSNLSKRRLNNLFRIMIDLYRESAHTAFLDGVQTGAQLVLEITQQETD